MHTPHAGRPVRRRHMVFLSGFDPRGPAYYHGLYAEHGPRQAQVSGYQLEVGRRRPQPGHRASWTVQGQFGEATVDTHCEFLRWDDLVRQRYWPKTRWQLLRDTLGASLTMISNGSAARALESSWPIVLALATPILLLLLGCLLLLGLLLTGLALGLAGQWLAAIALLLGGGGLTLWLGLRLARWSQMGWVMPSMASLVRQARGQTPDLDQRFDDFARHLADIARSGEVDELLVVGHCSGSVMATMVLSRMLAQLPAADDPAAPALPELSLLTLGHCIPALTYNPDASRYRAELAQLALDKRLHWVDFGAPPDGCCFPLVDPTAGCDTPIPPERRPKLLSPRFAQLFTPASYRRVVRDKYRCHFQYLMSAELPGAFDYFAMTAGPLTLAQRWRDTPSVTDFRQFQLLKPRSRR